jgi:hypothetical protein
MTAEPRVAVGDPAMHLRHLVPHRENPAGLTMTAQFLQIGEPAHDAERQALRFLLEGSRTATRSTAALGSSSAPAASTGSMPSWSLPRPSSSRSSRTAGASRAPTTTGGCRRRSAARRAFEFPRRLEPIPGRRRHGLGAGSRDLRHAVIRRGSRNLDRSAPARAEGGELTPTSRRPWCFHGAMPPEDTPSAGRPALRRAATRARRSGRISRPCYRAVCLAAARAGAPAGRNERASEAGGWDDLEMDSGASTPGLSRV